MARPMEETVNIPLLTVRVTWRRRSETAACRRNCRLKGVGYERGRQIHPSSRDPTVRQVLRDAPTALVTMLPRKSAKLTTYSHPYRKRTHVVGLSILRRLGDSRLRN